MAGTRRKKENRETTTKRAVLKAKSTPRSRERWRVVESVVAAIERCRGGAAGWDVTQNAMVSERVSKKRRQVDVFIRCPSGDRLFRVGIDVKDESAPLDIEDVEQLCAKGRKLDLDRYVIVSTSGFTSSARDEAGRCGVQLQTMTTFNARTVFAFDTIQVRRFRVHNVMVIYEEGADSPERAELRTAWLETDEACLLLAGVAERSVHQQLCARRELATGVLHEVRLVDSDRVWKALWASEARRDPPAELRAQFEVVVEQVPGEKFFIEGGREAFSAALPVGPGGEYRQVTMIKDPLPGGGFQLVLSTGAIKPQRQNV